MRNENKSKCKFKSEGDSAQDNNVLDIVLERGKKQSLYLIRHKLVSLKEQLSG